MNKTGAVITLMLGVGLLTLPRIGIGEKGQSGLRRPSVRAIWSAHRVHAQKGVGCERCHKTARTALSAKERLLPSEAQCQPCHGPFNGQDHLVDESCQKCHRSLDPFVAKTTVDNHFIRFSHRHHRRQPCGDCHGPVGGEHRYSMDTCMECHQRKGARLAACATCHLTSRDGTLKKRVNGVLMRPTQRMLGPNHGPAWVNRHGGAAKRKPALCANCHLQKECIDCHAGRIRQRSIHPAGWLTMHSSEAKVDRAGCQNCHRAQGSCLQCHRRAGVATDSPLDTVNKAGRRIHGNRAPDRICREARRNINACVSCHSEHSCVQCHVRINPHPPGFAGRCAPLARAGTAACLKCHPDGAQQRCK